MITRSLQPASLTEAKVFGARMPWGWREHQRPGLNGRGGGGSAVSGEQAAFVSSQRCHLQGLTPVPGFGALPLLLGLVWDPFVTWSIWDPFVTCLAAFCACFEYICTLFLLATKTDL